MTSNLGLGLTGTLVLFLFIVFLLGFVLDWTANVLICVPLFLPVLAAAGVDPIWFGTMVIIVIQTSYLTPPMASSIFYLLSIAPPDIKYGRIRSEERRGGDECGGTCRSRWSTYH